MLMFVLNLYTMSVFKEFSLLWMWITGIQQQLITHNVMQFVGKKRIQTEKFHQQSIITHKSIKELIIYQVSKLIHSGILLVKRGSCDSHEIQLLTA